MAPLSVFHFWNSVYTMEETEAMIAEISDIVVRSLVAD